MLGSWRPAKYKRVMDENLIEVGVLPLAAIEPHQAATSLGQEMAIGFAERVRQFAAWVVIVLLIAVPAWILLPGKPGIAWVVWWAVVSIWAGLFAVRLAIHAFPGQSKPSFAVAIAVLALVNLLFSLSVLVIPVFAS
jgi:hypothetical protein